MALLLPTDDNGHPLGVVGFDYRGTQRLAVGRESVRNRTPIPRDIELVTLVATGACRFEVGDARVTADREASPVLLPGHYLDVPLRAGERHVAFVAEDADAPCAAYVMGRI